MRIENFFDTKKRQNSLCRPELFEKTAYKYLKTNEDEYDSAEYSRLAREKRAALATDNKTAKAYHKGDGRDDSRRG